MRWLDQLKLRLRTLFRRERVESELRREFEFHLEQQISENIAKGMSPEEARYAALRIIGHIAQLEERCRDQRGLHLIETTMHDVRYALRSLRKSPAFTLVAVLSLALGTGANTAIFSLIDSLLLNSLPVTDPQQLVFVRTNRVKIGVVNVSRTIFNRDIEEMQKATQIDGIASYGWDDNVSISVGGDTELAPAHFVSGTYFQVLGVRPAVGRVLLPADDREAGAASGGEWPAMISYGYWQRRFGGDPGVVGKRINVNTVPFSIVGVMPRHFDGLFVDASPDVVLPGITHKQVEAGSVSAGYPGPSDTLGTVFGRLKKGVPQTKAAAELTVIFRNTELSAKDTPAAERESIEKRVIEFEPAWQGSSGLRHQFAEPLRALMGVVAIVMLIACANIATLLLAKGGARRKEIAIRLSLGSSTNRIIRQLLTESLILSALGCVLGIALAVLAHNLMVKLAAGPARMGALGILWDLPLTTFIVLICIVNALLFGIVPAIRATKLDPNEVLKSAPETAPTTHLPFGRWLVTGQLGLAVTLVIGAGLFLGTLRNLYSADLGFDEQNVLLASLNPRLIGFDELHTQAFYKELLNNAAALPSVVAASVIDNPLFSQRANLTRMTVPGFVPRDGEDLSSPWVLHYNVGPHFFETLRMPLIAGRDFTEADKEKAPPVAVVNEAFVKHYFANKNPIGQKLQPGFNQGQLEIVGVVHDAHYLDVQDNRQETVFTPLLQVQVGELSSEQTLVIRTRQKPSQAASDVRAIVRRLDPDLPILDIRTISEQITNNLSHQRLMATFSSFFGGLALLLSAIGLYGVLAYNITNRTREIGIRMALGADRGTILNLVLGETGQLLLIGMAAGLALAWAASRLVKSMLYGLSAHDARIYAIAALLLIIVALIAAMVPARRAVSVDPMVALRYE